MVTISILTNTVRPSGNRRSDDTAFGAGTFSWLDPVHSWKAGPGEVMTVENLLLFLPWDEEEVSICLHIWLLIVALPNT